MLTKIRCLLENLLVNFDILQRLMMAKMQKANKSRRMRVLWTNRNGKRREMGEWLRQKLGKMHINFVERTEWTRN